MSRSHAPLLLPLAGLAACSLLSSPYRGSVASDAPEALSRFLEEAFLSRLDRDASLRARFGDPARPPDEWEDRSARRARIDQDLLENELRRLRDEFDPRSLDEESALSYRLFVYEAQRDIQRARWRDHRYLIRPEDGEHLRVPRTLRALAVRDEEDAEAYLARIASAPAVVDELSAVLEDRGRRGLIPPRFASRRAAEDCRAVISGRPFQDDLSDGAILADLRAKLARVPALKADRRTRLLERASEALVGGLRPAYERLIATLREVERSATGDHGVWSLPGGDEYYPHLLEDATTLPLTPDALHDLALQEVARVHDEMRSIVRQVDHPGGLPSFLRFLREDPQFFVPNDDEGRARLLDAARATLRGIQELLRRVVSSPPDTGLELAAGEVGGRSAYEPGTRGSPAVLVLDLADTRDVPRYLIQATVYRDGLPGRHLREALTRERRDLPRFRRALEIPAWSGGWDLYAARLPRDLGLYEDPYSDFGRLAEELWAAALLAVDTGVHWKRWTRDEATAWLRSNTAHPDGVCAAAVDRVLLRPGAAAAAVVGMVRTLELRAEARRELGDRFSLPRFHTVLLEAGPVPLAVLEERVDAWIEAR